MSGVTLAGRGGVSRQLQKAWIERRDRLICIEKRTERETERRGEKDLIPDRANQSGTPHWARARESALARTTDRRDVDQVRVLAVDLRLPAGTYRSHCTVLCRSTIYHSTDHIGNSGLFVHSRVVRKMRVISAKMEIQNTKNTPNFFKKFKITQEKIRSIAMATNMAAKFWTGKLVFLWLPVYRRSQTQRLSSDVPLMLRLSSFPRCVSPLSLLASFAAFSRKIPISAKLCQNGPKFSWKCPKM